MPTRFIAPRSSSAARNGLVATRYHAGERARRAPGAAFLTARMARHTIAAESQASIFLGRLSPVPVADIADVSNAMRPRLLLVVPTYNEQGNLPALVARVLAALPAAEILVVDDA